MVIKYRGQRLEYWIWSASCPTLLAERDGAVGVVQCDGILYGHAVQASLAGTAQLRSSVCTHAVNLLVTSKGELDRDSVTIT